MDDKWILFTIDCEYQYYAIILENVRRNYKIFIDFAKKHPELFIAPGVDEEK